MAERVQDLGALVVGIDIRAFVKSLEGSKGCAYPAGALEELSRVGPAPPQASGVQAADPGRLLVRRDPRLRSHRRRAARRRSPGRSASASVRTSRSTTRRAGSAGLSFETKVKGVGYDLAPFAGLAVPWMVLQGEADQVCDPAATRAFVAATGAARLFVAPEGRPRLLGDHATGSRSSSRRTGRSRAHTPPEIAASGTPTESMTWARGGARRQAPTAARWP